MRACASRCDIGVPRGAAQTCAGDPVNRHRAGVTLGVDEGRPLVSHDTVGFHLSDRDLDDAVTACRESGGLDIDQGVWAVVCLRDLNREHLLPPSLALVRRRLPKSSQLGSVDVEFSPQRVKKLGPNGPWELRHDGICNWGCRALHHA